MNSVVIYHSLIFVLSVVVCRLWQQMQLWAMKDRWCKVVPPIDEYIRWPRAQPPICPRFVCCTTMGRLIGGIWTLSRSSCYTFCFSSSSSRCLKKQWMGLRCKPCFFWKVETDSFFFRAVNATKSFCRMMVLSVSARCFIEKGSTLIGCWDMWPSLLGCDWLSSLSSVASQCSWETVCGNICSLKGTL